MFRNLILLSCLTFWNITNAQEFRLEEIMKGPEFAGYMPERVQWCVDNNTVNFYYQTTADLNAVPYTFSIGGENKNARPIELKDHQLVSLPTIPHDQKHFQNYYYNDNGNLNCYDYKTKTSRTIFSASETIGSVQRSTDGKLIFFEIGQNVFCYNEMVPGITQITNFKQDNPPSPSSDDSTYLQKQQRSLFPYIQLQDTKRKWNEDHNTYRSFPAEIYFGKSERIQNTTVSSNGHFVCFNVHRDSHDEPTSYEEFITEDGITQRRSARPKVSDNDPSDKLGIYNRLTDSVYYVSFSTLTDIKKKPAYLKEYGDTDEHYAENRKLSIHAPIVNEQNNTAVIDIRTYDNKDRWIVLVDFETGKIKELNHQHDEAWIGGPGISGWNEETATLGWLNNEVCYFQSEETGYSHLYSLNTKTGAKKQLTSGNWEVYETILSHDKKSIWFLANKIHPGVRNGYKLDIASGKITALFEGYFGIEWTLSPDETKWAIRKSTTTQPWELYYAANKEKAVLIPIVKTGTDAYKKLPLQTPEIITIPTSDGQLAYARIYKPSKSNGAAVLFVHGAGYLQNAHYYWSYYQREMLFHQKLAAEGYTVLDVDYRASEGYGRNWRTDIYRSMGERDLNDYIDAKQYLVKELGIDSTRVGIYGGSYGGFITLMGLLKTPGEFACGAALRSVTDWAHYNHEYTSNILNYPGNDPKAYEVSSPIYYAQNLQDPLLMLHGMVDDNVQFQDIIRLNQRFIELGKTNYNLAVFPTEAHGFMYTPAWVDEYRRIYELFNTNLLLK
jgi:dipeptidyl aminopeptidase/acylaminoacyl peptidase